MADLGIYHQCSGPFPEPIFFPLIPQVSLRRAQIHYLRAPVPVLLHLRALFAIIGVRDALPAANCAPSLEATEVALVADFDQSAGSDVGIADDAFAVAFFAKATDGDTWLFAAENEIWVMFCH